MSHDEQVYRLRISSQSLVSEKELEEKLRTIEEGLILYGVETHEEMLLDPSQKTGKGGGLKGLFSKIPKELIRKVIVFLYDCIENDHLVTIERKTQEGEFKFVGPIKKSLTAKELQKIIEQLSDDE